MTDFEKVAYCSLTAKGNHFKMAITKEVHPGDVLLLSIAETERVKQHSTRFIATVYRVPKEHIDPEPSETTKVANPQKLNFNLELYGAK